MCDELTTASAANKIHLMQEIDKGVGQLVMDCGKILINTLGKRAQIALELGYLGVLQA